MEQQLLQTGEEAISKLAGRAAEVQGLVTANFAAKSLADVQAAFEKASASGAPGAVNAEVVKVHTLVREQAAQAVAAWSKCPWSQQPMRPPSLHLFRESSRSPRRLDADDGAVEASGACPKSLDLHRLSPCRRSRTSRPWRCGCRSRRPRWPTATTSAWRCRHSWRAS